MLVNTARGAMVDEDALVDVLRTGPLAAAGLDVFSEEPLPAEHPLRSLPNVVLTPHVGWTTEEVLTEYAEIAARQATDYLAGGWTPDLLDPEVLPTGRPRRAAQSPALMGGQPERRLPAGALAVGGGLGGPPCSCS